LDQEDFAAFTTIAVSSGVLYDEYQQRTIPPHPVPKSVGWGRKADATVLVATTLGTPGVKVPVGPGVKEPVGPTPATPTPSPKVSGTTKPTTSSTGTSHGPVVDPLGDMRAEVDQDSMRVVVPDRAVAKPDHATIDEVCGTGIKWCPALDWMLSHVTPIGADGQPLKEVKSANGERAANQQYRDIVKGSRTVYVGKGKKKKKQMVGVVVDVNLELSGLRGKPVLLSWSLWRKGGTKQIYGTWLNENLAYELKAGSERDSASVNFWIPLPKGKGSYVVRSKLIKDGQSLATVDSEPIS
jgi:hypothetical protein